MVNADIFDADVVILALVIGTLVYGMYSKSKVAGYEVSQPPVAKIQKPTGQPLDALPGVPTALLKACANVVDTFGGVLTGPLAQRRLEPDRIRALIDEVLRRIRASNPALDIMCTSVDGGTCDADSSGSEQYEIVWIMYERTTNSALQIASGILAMDDGRTLITKMTPVTPFKELQDGQGGGQGGELRAADSFRQFTPYSLPIQDI